MGGAISGVRGTTLRLKVAVVSLAHGLWMSLALVLTAEKSERELVLLVGEPVD